MSDPVVIVPTPQLDTWDCGVACLQMLLGASYQEIRALIRAKKPDGLSVWQLRHIAASLERPLVYRAAVDDDDIGILDLERTVEGKASEWEGHYAVYVKGTVYNPAQGQWWTDVGSYLKASRYRIAGILKRKEEE